jgi:hypothetical protein
MIITLILQFIVSFIGMVMSIVPTAHIGQVPLVGEDIVTYLNMMVGSYNLGASILPYLSIVKSMLVYVILPFEISVLLLKVFLGSRTPVREIN